MSRLSVTVALTPGRITKQCLYCSSEFDAIVYSNRKYCPGRKCRQNAYLDRKDGASKTEQERKYLMNLKKKLEKKILNLSAYLKSVNSKLSLLEE